MIKTKIIATLGPACDDSKVVNSMIDCGVDVFRLNFSHGHLDEHAVLLETLNKARLSHRHTTAVMGDLCGPKIRTGPMASGSCRLNIGDKVTIVPGDIDGTAERFGTSYQQFTRDVQVGHRVFIDDGQIALRVVETHDDKTICQVVIGGKLSSRKGINLPDTNVSVPSITERDWQCVDWAIKHDLDFLALSFVRSADDIQQLRTHLRQAGSDIKIVAKIETPQALAHLESIVHAADVVLVARGDLGVEMDLAEVPVIQKRITNICRQLGKPVVVATQMLQSMIDSPIATRAEVSDVANAIMDFTDAVMLSGETAVGKYPLEAARTIGRIAQVTEAHLDQASTSPNRSTASDELRLTAAMAHSVGQIVEDIGAKLVAVWSQTGAAARFLSKSRIDAPILALSSDRHACNQMCLHYGVIPRCQPIPPDKAVFTHIVEKLILDRNWAQPGDNIVLVAGEPIGTASTTNTITVHAIRP